MANLNRIILVGRLATDPEVRATLDGIPITRFKLTVNRMTGGSDLMEIVAWRRLAEICGEYLKKGQLILIEGRIQVRSFEDQAGTRRWVTEIIARHMQMLEKNINLARPVEPVKDVETVKETNLPDKTELSGLAEEFIDDLELESDLPF